MNANAVIDNWLGRFSAALAEGNPGAVARLFAAEDCLWRDLVSFTWNIITLDGRDAIRAMLETRLADVGPCSFNRTSEAQDAGGHVEARIRYETRLARGNGIVRLKGDRCWILLTAMTELKGHEEKAGARRENGVVHGVHRNRKSWGEQRALDAVELGRTRQPYCLIIGGGQGGLALAARLKRLGVPTLIIERNAKIGDSWRKRYKSLCLHDPVWYDHMPYLPFPDHWPVFSPKDKLGDWLEAYAKVMELDCWTSATCLAASFDETRREWRVEVDRAGERLVVNASQLVLATGMSGVPEVPRFPGAESFLGE